MDAWIREWIINLTVVDQTIEVIEIDQIGTVEIVETEGIVIGQNEMRGVELIEKIEEGVEVGLVKDLVKIVHEERKGKEGKEGKEEREETEGTEVASRNRSVALSCHPNLKGPLFQWIPDLEVRLK